MMHAEIECLRNARLTGGYHNTVLCAPAARDFMQAHGIEVMDLDWAECRILMEEYVTTPAP
jgi:hypothetical protein